MKVNEAKSKFVYPDKLYARTNDNITLDISYAPQTLEAVEYVRNDSFIEKAVSWLEDNINEYTDGEKIEFTPDLTFNIDVFFQKQLIEAFKNYMKL